MQGAQADQGDDVASAPLRLQQRLPSLRGRRVALTVLVAFAPRKVWRLELFVPAGGPRVAGAWRQPKRLLLVRIVAAQHGLNVVSRVQSPPSPVQLVVVVAHRLVMAAL